MMGTRERSFVPLVQVSLEVLVPQDHFYRYVQTEIAPVLRSNESLGYILTAENTDHAKVHMTSP